MFIHNRVTYFHFNVYFSIILEPFYLKSQSALFFGFPLTWYPFEHQKAMYFDFIWFFINYYGCVSKENEFLLVLNSCHLF